MAADDEWLLLTAAAQVAGVSIDTIRRHANAGTLPVTRAAGGTRLFKRADVERWVKSRAGETTRGAAGKGPKGRR